MKQKIQTILIAVLTLVGVSYVQAEWTAPTAPPPGGNLSAPINAGDTEQTKTGLLNLAGGVFIGGLGLTTDSLIVAGEQEEEGGGFVPNEINGRLYTEGGLIIETGTSDPSTPEDGRIWLRTDL